MYNDPYGLIDAKLAIHFFDFFKLLSQGANFREENVCKLQQGHSRGMYRVKLWIATCIKYFTFRRSGIVHPLIHRKKCPRKNVEVKKRQHDKTSTDKTSK
jgi:hypothetical protein